jgi:beta-lactamase regulating signal transducer with metallopeptidase domain
MIEILNDCSQFWFDWISASTLQLTLLIVILWTIDRLFQKWLWPQLRFGLWMLVLLKLVLPTELTSPFSLTAPIAESSQEFLIDSNLWQDSPGGSNASEFPQGGISSSIRGPSASNDSSQGILPPDQSKSEQQYSQDETAVSSLHWKSAALLIWFGGIAVLMIWLMIAGKRLRKSLLKIDDPTIRIAAEWARRKTNLKKLPPIKTSEHLSSPAVLGIFRPMIILPSAQFKSIYAHDLRHIFLHEMTHICRRDLWMQRVALILQIIYWFNPLMILVRSKIQLTTELCCDASITDHLEENWKDYRNVLADFSKRAYLEPSSPTIGELGLLEKPNQIIERLKWLGKSGWRDHRWKWVTVGLAILVVAVTVVPMTAWYEDLEPYPNYTVIWVGRSLNKYEWRSFNIYSKEDSRYLFVHGQLKSRGEIEFRAINPPMDRANWGGERDTGKMEFTHYLDEPVYIETGRSELSYTKDIYAPRFDNLSLEGFHVSRYGVSAGKAVLKENKAHHKLFEFLDSYWMKKGKKTWIWKEIDFVPEEEIIRRFPEEFDLIRKGIEEVELPEPRFEFLQEPLLTDRNGNPLPIRISEFATGSTRGLCLDREGGLYQTSLEGTRDDQSGKRLYWEKITHFTQTGSPSHSFEQINVNTPDRKYMKIKRGEDDSIWFLRDHREVNSSLEFNFYQLSSSSPTRKISLRPSPGPTIDYFIDKSGCFYFLSSPFDPSVIGLTKYYSDGTYGWYDKVHPVQSWTLDQTEGALLDDGTFYFANYSFVNDESPRSWYRDGELFQVDLEKRLHIPVDLVPPTENAKLNRIFGLGDRVLLVWLEPASGNDSGSLSDLGNQILEHLVDGRQELIGRLNIGSRIVDVTEGRILLYWCGDFFVGEII